MTVRAPVPIENLILDGSVEGVGRISRRAIWCVHRYVDSSHERTEFTSVGSVHEAVPPSPVSLKSGKAPHTGNFGHPFRRIHSI